MGNEASLEGEGAEGAADGGARGPASVAAGGVQEDLSRLSEEERKQIAAVMARTQQGPPGAEPPPMARHPPVDSSQQPRQASKSPDPRQPTLSKSRTVDTLKTEQRVPGRSPSATSLRQSQSRTDFKEDPKPSMMPSFLSDANPFGAVTSVVNKFNPFDLISESDPAQVGAAKNQKLAQKEQERPEQQKAPQKLPTQQSPKPMGPLQGAAPQKMGLSKQQQPPGVPKQAQPQGPSQPAGPRAEETKQQQGPPKTQPQQLESAKPVQQPSPAKPPTQQAGAAKASPQRLATAQPSTQAPASPKSGVQQGMPPGKTLIQQPGGPTKAAPQAAGPSKPPSQHPGGLAKPLPQLAHPTAPLSEQPGRPQPEGSLKLQPELGKTAQQHPTAPSQQASPPVESTPKKAFCPLCSTTELLTHPPDKANCNTCTRCQIVVCSLCGFNPNPHIVEIKEWLCLNCQMQRALGGDLAPVHGPGPQPSSPKQKIPATPSATKPPFQQQKPSLTKSPEPQKPPTQLKTPVAKVQPVESPPKSSQAKAPLMEDKQKQSGMQKPSGGAVPTVVASEPKQGAPGPQATSSQPKMMTPQRSESAKPLQHAAPADFKSSPQLSQQNPDPKTVSLPGPSLDVQAQRQAETVEMKESSKKIPPHVSPQPDAQRDLKGRQTPAGQKPAPSQPQAPSQQPQVKPEPPQHLSRTGGAITDAPKTQPTTPQESMTGKLFGFGASIFSQASNLISTGGQPGAQSPGPPSGSPSKQLLPPAQPPSQKDAQQAQPSPKASPAKRNIRPSMPEQPKVEGTPTVKETEGEKKTLPGKATKPQIAKAKPSVQEPSLPAAVCPLCKTALNVGSKEHSNYQKCTECKNVVCNLCGFNPMPHITGVQEWLCLNCQTQRALTGQLGDMGQLTPMLSKSSPKPSVSVPSQPKLTESSSQQKTTARPSQVIEKPKEVQEIKKEDPKLQQKKLSQDTSADKVQETVEKEHVTAQEKLEKTVSADKITQIVQGEDLKIQKLKLAKSPSADQIPKEELKLTIRPPADKISEVIPDDLTKISSTSNKIQKVISAKAPSSQKAQNGNQELKAAEPQSADQIQKDDTNLQQVKLPKAPPADIKKEETKIQQVKLAEPSPADKIVQQFQKEHLKHQEEKLTEVPSTSDFKRQAPTLKQAKLDKIPSADQIWKDESKLKHGKIVKTSSADQLRLDDPKLVQVKPVKMPVVGPVPSKSSTDPAQLARTVEDDTKSPSLQNIPQFPETKLELVTGEAEEKLETKLPEGTRKKEAIKKEDSAIEIPKALSEDQKSQKDISVTTPLAKPDHIEALKGKAETEDKSDTSSSQQQKSPQGLSDTGYSSDGISSSLGEIPSLITSDEKDMLKEPYKQETLSQESSPTSPSDLAKLESTVLSILEAQACSLAEEKSGKTQVLSDVYPEQTKDTHKTKPLPIAPDSCSSDDEDLMAPKIPGKNGGTPAEDGKQSISSQKKYKQMAGAMEDASTRRQRYDSVDDSSESENSPVPQRKRRTSIGSSSSDEYKLEDSPGSGDEEELIRKQILEMSADEDASGSEDDKFIRNQLKEISANESPIKEEVKCKKGTAGKHKRIMRKSSIGYEEDASRRHSWHDDDDDETFDESPELKYRETKSQDSEEITGGGLRRFKTIELNSTIANKYSEESEQPKRSLYFDEEPELEMESLTDSPEDRSRGEGSSSLHASSFTPGTSPTSVSSLDEDSDSSPSHKKMGGESKQHRKARHRTHGPLLPTIEDSSEEEELREEEELLKEQEKQRELEQQQRKSSSKKSKKDKEELRAQRRRERPKTPPSNLSPIEDASPTEELRQAAEMEELHRSSCSEYSPSIESDPETFEISPEKIIEVQKVYKLPTSVSLYSPTEEQPLEVVTENSGLKTLKSAEEVYEEMLHTSLKAQKFADVSEKDEIFEKEPLYGGMLIEDYIYESLVEDTYSATPEASLIAKQSENDEFCQQRDKEKKTKPLGQLDGGPIQTSIDVQKEYYSIESLHSVIAQEDIVCSSYIMPESHEIVVLDSEAPSSSDEKQLLDADAAYEEFMRQQGMPSSPSSSPTQLSPDLILPADKKTSGKATDSMLQTSGTPSTVLDRPSLSSVALPIPDVRITQHFTADEIEDEYLTDYAQEIEEIISHEASILTYSEASESAASVLPSDASSLTSSTSSVYTTGSSSPVAGPDGMTLSYAETVDTVSKLSDADRTSSVNQVPITSTKEYSESAVLLPKKAFLAKDTTHLDQISVSLPEVASIMTTSTDTKPRPVVPISVALETVSSIGDKGRQDVIPSKVVRELYEEEQKRAVIKVARTAFTDFVPEEEFTFAAPVSEPTPIMSSYTSTVPTLPSAVSPFPTVASKTFSFVRSSSLDSPVQPSPLPPSRPPPLPPPPPPPPPILPKPALYPKKKPLAKAPLTTAPTIVPSVSSVKSVETTSAIKTNGTLVTRIYTTTPPPVPPKPASIPSGLVFTHRPPEIIKPPIAPKPAIPQMPTIVHKPAEVQPKPNKGSSSAASAGMQKKVKRTLPNPPPEDIAAGTQSAFTTAGSMTRRRICRSNTMARAKILQDIDRELDLVERESAKLRKKQAELDEEEKEIDAKLRYLEMGINRRKEALLKEREKRERDYLQGVAEERDYMSDSEVSSTRPARIEAQHGLERPRTAPQTEFDQFIPAQSQPETQFATPTSPYTQYKYSSPALPTQASIQYTQQSHYQQQQTLYQPPQASPYQTQSAFQTVATMSFSPQAQPPPTQQPSYQLSSQLVVIPQKTRQTSLYLEPKITTNYDVIRNQPLMIAPSSSDNTYAVSHLGSKYSTLDLRMGLDERSSIASSPISSISGDSFYADIDHHTPRNYVLIDDIGDLTKGTSSLSSAYGLHEKDLTKTDRLLRTTEARRVQDVSDFLPPLQTSSRLHNYMKTDEDPMEDPYELKLLKHQIKQEFRRGAESLDHVAGLSQYYHGDTSYRHFPKSEKYSISRLTLEKQAAKQLPAALLYQKQSKHKKALIDPKLSKFSPIQESRDLELDYSTYLTSSTSSLGGITSRARLLQDDVTFGLRKNIADQQKFMGPTLVHSLGTSLGAALSTTMRSTLQDDVDKPYGSGSRSRPSSRPSSIYGIDLSLKRDSSSSSLRLKTQEAEPLDIPFSHAAPSGRTKPTSLPISQSRGRIPIVAQNSEEESPLSPVGQPMGMARAAAGPLPPISADTRDQFGSSHSLPEVQQHMREESRARGYDRDIAFIMDDFQHAMSDSEAYHLRREETDWFDKPRESHLENGHGFDRRLPDKLAHSRPPSQHQDQINGKPIQYIFPHARLKLLRDPKDRSVSGNGLGIRVVGGKEIPGANGEIGAYIAKIMPGGSAEQTGKVMEGMQVLEWNGIPLTAKTYEEVQSIISQQSGEAEICVRLDLNMLSDAENPQHLELLDPGKTVEKTKSPGVDPKQLAAELQKVSLQQAPLVVSSAMDKGSCAHSGTTSATSSSVPSPGQPGSPSVSKKRHSGKQPAETVKSSSHPVTGEIQLQINYDKHLGNLIIHVLQARNLAPRDNNGYSDPFVKVYLLPGRGQVMVVQNASVENKRRTKYIQKTLNPEWNQTVIYKNISTEQLKKKTLEVTVWDYDRFSSNDLLGEVLIELSSTSQLDNTPRWYPLKEQSEGIDHGKSHSGQNSQQSPKPSVIKSRSHGIFPDPSKDMPVPTIEKSHSSPGSSKSSSEGHLRSHGPSRSQSKTSVTQTHLEDAGAAIAAAEAAVQQLRLQPTAHKSGQSNNARKQHRHSIAGVLPIQRTQSDNLPPPASDNKDQSQLALRKVMSDGPAKPEGAKPTNHRQGESSVSAGSSASSFGSGYSVDSEGSSSASITGDSNLFPIPRIGKMNQNGQETAKPSGVGLTETEGKTQMVGEIKIALKKEMKTDGEQLIVEILQCRNITYKFKSPDHLPDLYVKLYVVNLATQKRVMKKKTRVCRHDREPSFNETFRFSLNPSGHSLQILLVSNGGKFMKKTLIGEAYIWLDKVDLRKRTVNWHKLLVSSTQAH
ncbi:protein piccolo isoform X6 [Paroedura picta]|uniref:protein piccolo isoform X6 n=1 Tax=Paroedura picta TaxID=143630 RepID=UPI0040573781